LGVRSERCLSGRAVAFNSSNMMTRRAFLLIIPAAPLVLSGCTEAAAAALGVAGGAVALGTAEYVEGSAITEEILSIAGKEAAIWGLKKLDPITAAAAAKVTVTVCQDSIAYLQSGELPAAMMINQILSAKFKALHPEIYAEIQTAAWVLSKFVPTADVFLSSAQIGDLVSFLGGIQAGAQQFIVNPAVSVKQKYTKHKPKTARVGDAESPFPAWFSVV
jgi:hypothetical protein